MPYVWVVDFRQLRFFLCIPIVIRRLLKLGILEWVAMPSSGDLPHPGTEPTSLTAHGLVDFLSSYHGCHPGRLIYRKFFLNIIETLCYTFHNKEMYLYPPDN